MTTERIARIQDKHYMPVLTVDVYYGEADESGVLISICRDQALADKNPKDSGDAPHLRTIGITFEDAKMLAKALKKAAKGA